MFQSQTPPVPKWRTGEALDTHQFPARTPGYISRNKPPHAKQHKEKGHQIEITLYPGPFIPSCMDNACQIEPRIRPPKLYARG